MTTLNVGGIAFALALMALSCAAEAAVKVSIDINDPSAPRGTVRSFSGNGLTLGTLKAKVGSLKPGQTVSMWCEGLGMGVDGTSAFDVMTDAGLSPELRKLKVSEGMRLEDVCQADAKAFRSRR